MLRQDSSASLGAVGNSATADTREHVLLTVLGTNTESAHYTLDGRDTRAQVAPVALFQLLPEAERPARVLALCTPEAKQIGWPPPSRKR